MKTKGHEDLTTTPLLIMKTLKLHLDNEHFLSDTLVISYLKRIYEHASSLFFPKR